MLTIPNILLSVTALCNVGMALFIQSRNRTSKVNFYLALFSVCLALWAIVLIAYSLVSDLTLATYFMKASYIAALIIAISYYFFSKVFPDEQPLSRIEEILVFIPACIFIICIIVFPSFLTHGIVLHSWGKETLLGVPEYLYFAAMFVYLFIGGLIRIWLKYLKATGSLKIQLLAVGGSVTIAGVLGMYFNLLLPSPFLHDFQYIWSGPIFTFFIAVTITYSIFRLRFFNPKAILAELFVYVLLLFLFVRLIITNDLSDLLINGALLIAVGVVGTLLIRSVSKEVEQREEIEKLSQEKSEFMSFASHEIRNPITAMRGYASFLVDGTSGEVPTAARDIAQKILVNGDTVLSLISEFLNKSKLELGQISYNVADIDVGKVIQSTSEGFKAHAREKGLTLDIRVDFPNLMAKADEAKLREVVGNLIDNSVKYTKSGGVAVRVEKRNGMARITVSDTGVGIPPETIHNLFQKFSRADAQKMNLLGTGLGLYLAKNFIEGMGGKIWVESDGKDKGSRFIIELHTV